MRTVLARPSTADVVLVAGLLVLGQLTTWLRLDTPDAFAGDRAVNACVLALGLVPALWRRSAPATAVAASAAILCLPHAVADLDVTVLGQFVPLVVVTASCGYHARTRPALLAVAWALSCMAVVSWTTPFLRTPSSALFNALILVAPWAAARALRHREDRAWRLGKALEQERSQFQDLMTQAVERERAQIARDLHDVVAHGVSVMVVQIGGARLQLAEDSVAAGRSLLAAEDAGRRALSDLRSMLVVLRAPSEVPETTPRPGLAQLDVLVRQAASAGLQVRTSVTGEPERLPAAVDLSAYRILQESITNVLKHSTAGHADLTIEVTDRRLRLAVRDGGPARRSSETGGHGVMGIRERVAFLGGDVSIGNDGTEGWRVAVAIPIAGMASGLQTVPARREVHS